MPRELMPSTLWDVEQYRNEWESDEQWDLRKQFMLAYRDSIPEDKLVCWGQVFANIETYQCRYPRELMDQIKELALKLNYSYKDNVQKLKDAVLFVKEDGNDAPKMLTAHSIGNATRKGLPVIAEESICTKKHLLKDKNSNGPALHATYESSQVTCKQGNKYLPYSGRSRFDVGLDSRAQAKTGAAGYTEPTVIVTKVETGFPGLISYGAPEIIDMNMLRKSEKCNVERVNNHNQKSKETGDGSHHMEVDERGIKHPYWQQSVNSDVISLTEVIPEASTDPYLRCFNNFVILIDENLIKKSPTGLLNDSAQFNKKSYKLNLTTENSYVAELNGVIIGNATEKQDAAAAALKNLSQVAYTLIVKPRENDVNSRMSKMDLETVLVKEGHPCRASLDEAIPENNMGHKLLRLMGWSGGGLGKAGNEGIIEPVRVQRKFDRKGLGLEKTTTVTTDFKRKMSAVLKEFALSCTDDEFVFSSEFTLKEREEIHRLARKFHLHSSSRGSKKVEGARYLTVRHISKQKERWQAFRQGIANDKYEVLVPGSSWPRIEAWLNIQPS